VLDLDVSKLQPDMMDERWYVMLEDYIIDLACSVDGDQAVAMTVEGAVILIDFDRESARYEQIGSHNMGGASVSWNPESHQFATGGHDGLVKIWDARSRLQVGEHKAGNAWVSRVAYSHRRGTLAAAAGKWLKVWSQTGNVVYESNDHKSTISDLAWNQDGSSIAVSAAQGVTIHTPGADEPVRRFVWQGASLRLAWSPSNQYIATGEQDATVHFWFVESGQDARMAGFATKVQELAWHHSGNYLAVGGASSPTLWDCSGDGPVGRAPVILESHVDLVTQLAYQHRGEVLASGDSSGFLMLWLPTEHDKIIWGTKLPSPVTRLVWSPDDARIFVGQKNGLVTMFEKN
jgi:WD40 repeat protein